MHEGTGASRYVACGYQMKRVTCTSFPAVTMPEDSDHEEFVATNHASKEQHRTEPKTPRNGSSRSSVDFGTPKSRILAELRSGGHDPNLIRIPDPKNGWKWLRTLNAKIVVLSTVRLSENPAVLSWRKLCSKSNTYSRFWGGVLQTKNMGFWCLWTFLCCTRFGEMKYVFEGVLYQISAKDG